MVGIADEFPAGGIDDEVEHFQGDLPDQYGAFVGNLRHLDDAVALLNREPHGFIDSEGKDARGGTGRSGAAPHQAQLCDDPLWQRQEGCAGVHQSVWRLQPPHCFRGQQSFGS